MEWDKRVFLPLPDIRNGYFICLFLQAVHFHLFTFFQLSLSCCGSFFHLCTYVCVHECVCMWGVEEIHTLCYGLLTTDFFFKVIPFTHSRNRGQRLFIYSSILPFIGSVRTLFSLHTAWSWVCALEGRDLVLLLSLVHAHSTIQVKLAWASCAPEILSSTKRMMGCECQGGVISARTWLWKAAY